MKRLKPYLAMRSVEELWTHHTETMAGFGFDRLFYAYSAFRNLKTLGNPDDALVLTNHPADYVEDYVNKGLFRDGPMMRWASRNVGAVSWRQVRESLIGRDMTAGERHVAALNKRFGLVAGYTISFPMAIKHASAGIGLTARAGLDQDDIDAIWARDGELIEIINHVAHLCISQLPATGQSRMLTRRQTEVLELVADGKTIQDIALLLERNSATVEKHLRGARDTLGVETTAQAVRKASILNQIFLIEPSRPAPDQAVPLNI
ncbi:LuxR family transcriptional regulator [Roseobacter sp. HKCCD9010]|uniref:LuxR family transcriptional regulator n=1 Tax=Rhodobacterales TaxID=204455 RepID=UPI0014918D3D|nr:MULTISPECIES: LuxR family transcriptional regulator [Rhodobacterales]MBF9050372.1 LuxR family transcriptional regulator [Rhodobacterales bacterium HKCCD4356]NNV14297.1 LuxR family transcriptional regulator [Roseobacter sp. HKCCD7357]NNV18490.1 LuxR family transcriptional regulator [Roseobacter sp. HKCCD8768]NNV27911.1 LuxR family transcriptional regulator [Roseobacter sp. HKCCD8192]NNV32222.1 LuxR family transcriptional regulator [Roseobacter sp. HKCCD9061]